MPAPGVVACTCILISLAIAPSSEATKRASIDGRLGPAAPARLYHIYSAKRSKLGWVKASEHCRNEFNGGRLVEIVSENTEYELATQFKAEGIEWAVFWTGLNDRKEEGEFVWNDDTPLNYTGEWLSGRIPNDKKKDCGILRVKQGIVYWMLEKCGLRRNFICEYILDPEPYNGVCGTRPHNPYGIFDGPEVRFGSWPWHATISFDEQHVCSGVIIADRWILTVGNCVHDYDPDDLLVGVGVVTLSNLHLTGLQATVDYTETHPLFSDGFWNFALLYINETIPLDNYKRPLCLPPTGETNFFADGEQCVNTWFSSNVADTALHEDISHIEKCEDFIEESPGSHAEICAATANDDNTFCPIVEDKGSPLVCVKGDGQWYLAGLYDYCGASEGVFARATAAVGWIENALVQGAGVCGKQTNLQHRIIGGRNAALGMWPWQVSFSLGGNHICGGVLVDGHWILTAAHCVHRENVAAMEVRMGIVSLASPSPYEFRSQVDYVVIHPNYRGNFLHWDYALIHVPLAVPYSDYIRPACLPPSGDVEFFRPENDICAISGWGALSSTDSSRLSIITTRVSWDDSFDLCRSYGMTLVKDTRNKKHRRIVNFITVQSMSTGQDFWIDARVNADGSVVTSDGPQSFTKWAADPTSGGGDCVQLKSSSGYYWDRDNCTETKMVICEEKTHTYPDHLQQAIVNLVDQESCNHAHSGSIADYHICSSNIAETGICLGDSGGPLVCKKNNGKWYLAGLSSWIRGACGTEKYPSVFARVTSAMSWILETLKSE